MGSGAWWWAAAVLVASASISPGQQPPLAPAPGSVKAPTNGGQTKVTGTQADPQDGSETEGQANPQPVHKCLKLSAQRAGETERCALGQLCVVRLSATAYEEMGGDVFSAGCPDPEEVSWWTDLRLPDTANPNKAEKKEKVKSPSEPPADGGDGDDEDEYESVADDANDDGASPDSQPESQNKVRCSSEVKEPAYYCMEPSEVEGDQDLVCLCRGPNCNAGEAPRPWNSVRVEGVARVLERAATALKSSADLCRQWDEAGRVVRWVSCDEDALCRFGLRRHTSQEFYAAEPWWMEVHHGHEEEEDEDRGAEPQCDVEWGPSAGPDPWPCSLKGEWDRLETDEDVACFPLGPVPTLCFSRPQPITKPFPDLKEATARPKHLCLSKGAKTAAEEGTKEVAEEAEPAGWELGRCPPTPDCWHWDDAKVNYSRSDNVVSDEELCSKLIPSKGKCSDEQGKAGGGEEACHSFACEWGVQTAKEPDPPTLCACRGSGCVDWAEYAASAKARLRRPVDEADFPALAACQTVLYLVGQSFGPDADRLRPCCGRLWQQIHPGQSFNISIADCHKFPLWKATDDRPYVCEDEGADQHAPGQFLCACRGEACDAPYLDEDNGDDLAHNWPLHPRKARLEAVAHAHAPMASLLLLLTLSALLRL